MLRQAGNRFRTEIEPGPDRRLAAKPDAASANFGMRALIYAPCRDFDRMRHVELGIGTYLGVDIVAA